MKKFLFSALLAATTLSAAPSASICEKVISGPPGPTGPAGSSNDSIGPTGPTGQEGPQGPQGNPGVSGPQGAAGSLGPDGAAGPEGTPGTSGALGSAGPSGPTGPIGPSGPIGSAGSAGAIGLAGPTSTVEGPTGPTGEIGVTTLDTLFTYNNAGATIVILGGVPIPFNQPATVVGTAISHDNVTDNSEIILNEVGTYRVVANINVAGVSLLGSLSLRQDGSSVYSTGTLLSVGVPVVINTLVKVTTPPSTLQVYSSGLLGVTLSTGTGAQITVTQVNTGT